MTLLAVAGNSIERARGDVAVIPLFAGETPLRAAAGRVDWRLCGHLSRLFASGALHGDAGEAVLVPGGGGLRVPRVMGLGIGPRRSLGSEAVWNPWIGDVIERSRKLGAARVALALPEMREVLAERLQQLAAVLSDDPGIAELWLCLEEADEIAANAWLDRTARRGRFPDLEIRALPDSRAPQGGAARGRPAPAASRSSHASADRFTR